VCLTVVALLLGFAAAPWTQQAPPPPPPPGLIPPPPTGPQPPAPTGTAFVAGQVIEIGTGQPVAGAVVVASMRPAAQATPPAGARAGGAFPPAVQADAQGRFYFANLPAGIISLTSEQVGFVASATALVELSHGERAVNVKLRLAKMGSLAGQLRDEAGDPVVGMSVAAFRRAIVNGRMGLQSAGVVRSDDRGAFRLASLAPGEYIVGAYGRDPNPFDSVLLTTLASQPINLMSVAARALAVGADVVSIDPSLRTHAPTFYPNSTTIARATQVAVAPGEERTDIHIQVAMVRAARVSGQVVGATSAVNASAIRLVPAADADLGIDATRIPAMLVQPDGRFDFASVPPGQYRLIATHRETGVAGGSPSGIAMGFAAGRGLMAGFVPPPPPPAAPIRVTAQGGVPAPLWADDLITVPGDGLSGVVVTLNQPASVRGRVQYVGGAPQPTEQMLSRAAALLQPITVLSAGTVAIPLSSVSPDGTFMIPSVLPGRYVLTSMPLPGFPTLRSVVAGGVDITDLPLEIGRRDVGDIVITMSDVPLASLTATMPDAVRAEETDRFKVLVFPADRKYWVTPAAAARRMRTLPLSVKGAATASGLPAGDYHIVAVSNEEAANWMEAPRIEILARGAQRLTLTDGEQRTLEVRR